MRQRTFLPLIWAALAALFISGCAMNQLPPAADNVEKATRAAVQAQKQADAAERVAKQLLDERVISSDDALSVYHAADDVRAAALAAHMVLARKGDANTAMATLQAARSSLQILEAFLTSRKE